MTEPTAAAGALRQPGLWVLLSPKWRTAIADASAAASRFTTLLPTRIVTSSREVEPSSERAATAAGLWPCADSRSRSLTRSRSIAVSEPEKKAESTRQPAMMSS